jgi:hypothetical protein
VSAKKKMSAHASTSVESGRIEIAKYDIRFKFFRHIVTAIGWLIGFWLLLEGLPGILIQGKAEEIRALSSIISALRPGSMLGYLIAAVLFGLYRLERAGKKRAIKEKARLQKVVERSDPNRTSSNLTSTGGTPNGRSEHE